jgi:hypothetical protein
MIGFPSMTVSAFALLTKFAKGVPRKCFERNQRQFEALGVFVSKTLKSAGCKLKETRETTPPGDAERGRSIHVISLALSPQGCVSYAQSSGRLFKRRTEVENSADVFLFDCFERHLGIGVGSTDAVGSENRLG